MLKESDYAISPSNWVRWRSKCQILSGMHVLEQTGLRFEGGTRNFNFLRERKASEGTRNEIASRDDHTLWIVPEAGCMLNGDFDWEIYSPFDNKSLHRTFSKCRELDDLKTFFDKFGPLGVQTCAIRKTGEPKQVPATMGEPLEVWMYERSRMAFLVTLWDALRLKDRLKLDSLIQVDRSSVWAQEDNEPGWIPKDIREAWCPFLPTPGEPPLRQAARKLMQTMLSVVLAEHSIPTFTLVKGAQIRIMPQTLFGVMHVQLLREAIGSIRNIVLCPSCGEYFSQEHGRMKYCSQACRQKAYVTRKSEEEETNG